MQVLRQTPTLVCIIGLLCAASSVIYLSCGRQGVPIHVVEVSPQGEVNRNTNVSIYFSGDVVPPESLGVLLDQAPVTIEPAISGRFKWIDNRTLRFFPTEHLRPSTRYKIDIYPSIIQSPGSYLQGKRQFEFYTSPLKVEDVFYNIIRDGAEEEKGYFSIRFIFSEVVDPSVVIDNLSVLWDADDGKNPLEFVTDNKKPSTQLNVVTEIVSNIDAKGVLKLQLKRGVPCLDGNIPLEKDFTRDIRIRAQQELKVERVTSGRESDDRFWVHIRFSGPVVLSEVNEYVEFEPKMDIQSSSTDAGHSVRFTGHADAGAEILVKVSEGLRAIDGSQLKRTFSQSIVLEDLPPSLIFTSPGKYLSASGMKNVEIEVVNIDKIHVEVEKIYRNNLVYFLGIGSRGYYGRQGQNFGHRIYDEDMDIDVPRNQKTKVTVNFDRFHREHRAGLFRLTIRQGDRYWQQDSKSVLLTNMGIIAKRTGTELAVWVISTVTLQPISGVEVTLISSTNQEMNSGRTNYNGLIVLPLREISAEYDPYLITANLGDDLSYLLFNECRISTSDFKVKGRSTIKSGYESMLYTDRGVYRPGETVHLACIIRGTNFAVPESFPLRLEVLDPTGQQVSEQTSRTQVGGVVDFDIAIADYARTGWYIANLYGPGKDPIGVGRFSVEEFMPDRIKVDITTDKDRYKGGETMNVGVTGTMLFGPPAAGRKVEALYTIESVPFRAIDWSSYQFGDPDKLDISQKGETTEKTLDAQGAANFSFVLPKQLAPQTAMQVIVSGQVSEMGGRAVTAYAIRDLHIYPFYIGLRRENDAYGNVGDEEIFNLVTVDPDGNPVSCGQLTAKLFRVRWRTVLKRQRSGQYRYQSEKWEELQETKNLTGTGDVQRFSFRMPDWGQYKVVVTDPSSGAASAVSYYVRGWGYTPWSMEHPDRIEIELNQEQYQPGDEAQVLIKAPFAGKLLLTVEREKLFDSQLITMDENTATIPIKVKQEYLPNAYVTATLIRSPESLEEHAPARAYGTVPLFVNVQDYKLQVDVNVPEITRPLTPITVDVQVTDHQKNAIRSALVTIAVVDEGILQLTDFKSPDPMGLFYAKRRLQVDTYDMFSLLLPETEGSELFSAPSGGRVETIRREHLSPVTVRRVKPVAMWSGILHTDQRGNATVTFDLPQFNGKLRAMVVVSSNTSFGSGDAYITVRDPIVLTPTFPRFISINDDFMVPVTVYNDLGKDANIQLSLAETSPLDVAVIDPSKALKLPNEQEGSTQFHVKAGNGMGKVTFVLTAESLGEKVTQSVDLPLRPPAPRESITGAGSISEGNDVTFTMPGGWIPGSDRYAVSLSSIPLIKFSKSLTYLLRYPYGCVEQTTSKAFPLLYFKDLAKVAEPGVFKGNAPEYYVSEAIQKLTSMSQSDGHFSFWPNSPHWNRWSSIYALHFLTEAEKAGYYVNPNILKKGRKFLKETVRSRGGLRRRSPSRRDSRIDRSSYNDPFSKHTLRTQTYAAYVLALMGKPEIGSMHYFLDDLDKYLLPDSKIFLSGAFALSGDLNTAYSLLPISFRPQTEERETGGNFSSGTRMNAIALSIFADVAPEDPAVPVLVKHLSDKMSERRYYTTQECAWSFMALGKVLRQLGTADYRGDISIDGEKQADFAIENFVFTDSALCDKEITVSIQGEGTCFYFWEARGIPLGQQFDEEDIGLEVRRSYYSIEKKPISPESLRHGDLVVAEITVNSPNQSVENVIIDDMLPAGLEIENPRLSSRASISWITDDVPSPDYMDIRDDRILLFTSVKQGEKKTFYYALRAVTVGTFVLPPISAECMYDPTLKSIAGSGFIKILP